MRELNSSEIVQVQGGVLLAVAAAVGSFLGHQAVRSVGGFLLARAMTTYSVVAAAKAAGDAKKERAAAKKDN